MTKEEIYQKIDLQTRIKYKKKNDLAEVMGVSAGNLANIYTKINRNENMNLDTFFKLISCLDLEIIIQEKK